MNYLDFIILAVVIYFTVKGLFRGFFQEVLGFLGFIFAFIVATKFMSNAAAAIQSFMKIPPMLTTLLGFLVIFFGIVFISHILTHILQKIFRYSALGWFEKLAGGLVGFLKGATIMSLLSIFISMIPFGTTLIPGLKESQLFEPTQRFAPNVFNKIMKIVPDSKSFYGELKESFENFSQTELAKNTQNFLKTFKNNGQNNENKSTNDDPSQ
ncbi:MAG: CvpA family protein [bacterium]